MSQQPCRLTVGELRKIVTRARKDNHLTGPANKEQLVELFERQRGILFNVLPRMPAAFMYASFASRTRVPIDSAVSTVPPGPRRNPARFRNDESALLTTAVSQS